MLLIEIKKLPQVSELCGSKKLFGGNTFVNGFFIGI